MAKRGIMYYLVIGSGFLPLVYLYYYDRKTYKRELDPEQQIIQAQNKQKLVTVQEQRLIGERTKANDVPIADEENGYM
jgi:hypothetical protein